MTAMTRSKILFLTLFFLVLGAAVSGCTDSFVAPQGELEDGDARVAQHDQPKLRHAHLFERAVRDADAGKGAAAPVGLIIKANGVVNRYGLTQRYGITQRYEYNDVFYGLAGEVDSAQLDSVLAEMATDPDIIWVEPDFNMTMPPSNATAGGSSQQQIPWSVAAIGGQTSWAVSGDGQGTVGVDVFVLDTGVANANNNDPNDDLLLVENVDFRPGMNDAKDYYGHGTHVAGIIGAYDDNDGLVGIAPGVWVHNLKVLGDDGTADVSLVIAAIEHVTAAKLAAPAKHMVVNLSLGEDINTPEYSALDEAVEASIQAGVVYVIAAGNESRNVSNVTPAKVDGAITVGSYATDGSFSAFSNWGPKVDLLAPGEGVISLGSAASGATGPVAMSGTSMSAAHVTGAAALYMAQNPSATPAQVQQALIDSAWDMVTGTTGSTTSKSVWVGASLPGSGQIVEARVASGNDDAEEDLHSGGEDEEEDGGGGGSMSLGSSDLELITDRSTQQLVGMRFTGLMIPQGATITNAYVQFTVDETDSRTTNLTFRGQDADDAASFSSSSGNISSRPTTSASVAWSPPAWNSVGAAGANQRTPDLSTIIQEIVDRVGWASGNDLVIIVSGSGERTAESYDGDSSKAPLLHVEYQTGAGKFRTRY